MLSLPRLAKRTISREHTYLPRLVLGTTYIYKKFKIAMDFFGDRVTITTAKRVERNGF